jgi:hypothetical protein
MAIIASTDIGDGTLNLIVDHDPTAVATDAPKGSIIIDSNKIWYRKIDDGATTNVKKAFTVEMLDTNGGTNSIPVAQNDGSLVMDYLSNVAAARKVYHFLGDMFLTTNTSDWPVTAPAGIQTDTGNASIVVGSFDDTTSEGVGMEIFVPSGATEIMFVVEYRPVTAPGTSATVDWRWHFRRIPDNAAIGSWTTVDMNSDTVLATSGTNYRYSYKSFSLATVGITANSAYQIEYGRYPAGSDTLTGDVLVRSIRVYLKFSGVNWYPADTLQSILSSNWSINANAAIASDSNNTSLRIRRHDDAVEEGSGIIYHVPFGVTYLKLYTISRAQTTPGATASVALTLHYRKMGDNEAIGAWVQYDLPVNVSIPTNQYWQYDSWEINIGTLATPIISGASYQFELTRNSTIVGDTLTGDWDLWMLGMETY